MQQTTPLISVIIPSYNHQAFIGAAIDSVLQQTYQHFELIVIDDHSSDRSLEVIEKYQDPRIKLDQHAHNIGASETINEGIRQARGDYIAILNSDDVFMPNRLARLLEVAQQESAAFITTDVELIDKTGEIVRDKNHYWIQWVDELRARYASSGDIVQAILAGNFFISTSNFFIHRTVFERIGYFHDYRYTSDYEFILRYLADNYSRAVYLFDEKLLQYRLHGSNTILEAWIPPHLETFQILTRWLPEIIQQPLDKQRCRATNHQLERILGAIMHEHQRTIGELSGTSSPQQSGNFGKLMMLWLTSGQKLTTVKKFLHLLLSQGIGSALQQTRAWYHFRKKH